jgi:hypothetical protein
MIRKIKAQEEMVGFAVIIVIVAVVMLIFLWFYLRTDTETAVKSYEIESFLQAMLHYTIDYNSQKIAIIDLIKECNSYEEGCDKLNKELKEIIEESWNTEKDSKIRGYELDIYEQDKQILLIQKGNKTNDYSGSSQPITGEVIISLKVYN